MSFILFNNYYVHVGKIKNYRTFFNRLKDKAFTLLELLVVIGIIAIIVSLGFASYSTTQKKVRDAKRKSDLKEIQNALEQYYAVCGSEYPDEVSSTYCPDGAIDTSIVCNSPSLIIMDNVPTDPKTGNSYCYDLGPNRDTYILSTEVGAMETESTQFRLENRQ